MAKAQVQVEVEKEIYDVMEGLAKFVAAVKAAHASGANLAVAIPMDIAAAVADLAPLVGEVGGIASDFSESKSEFVKAVMLGSMDIAQVFLG